MAKKRKAEPSGDSDEESLGHDLSDAGMDEGESTSDGEIVAENASGEVKKKGWTGDVSNQWRKGRVQCKPPELLLAFRKVLRGNLSDKDLADPKILSVLQLKTEDNSKFLTELRALDKEHKERLARKSEWAAKKAESEKSTVAKDASTEDLVSLVGDLLAEFCKA